MYCVIGEKVLKCDVIEKQEAYSWCKIGEATKNKSIPNTKLFTTQEQAQKYMKDRDRRKGQQVRQIEEDVKKCKEIYEELYKETGINVRVIDRKFRVADAQKHANKVRKGRAKKEAKNEAKDKADLK